MYSLIPPGAGPASCHPGHAGPQVEKFWTMAFHVRLIMTTQISQTTDCRTFRPRRPSLAVYKVHKVCQLRTISILTLKRAAMSLYDIIHYFVLVLSGFTLWCMLFECCSLDWPCSLLPDPTWTTLAATEMDGTTSGESVRQFPSCSSFSKLAMRFWR